MSNHLYMVEDGLAGDPLIWWPGAIEDLARQVDAQVESLARSVSDERKKTGQLVIQDGSLAEFKAFYNEWKAHLASLWFGSYLTGATADRLKVYEQRALDWREFLLNKGSTTVAASPAPPNPNAGFPWMKTLFVLGGVAVGAYALSKVVDLGKLIPKST